MKILRSVDLETRKEVEGSGRYGLGREQPEKNKRNNYFRKGLKGRVDSPYG